ncbi:---NA---, partial [Paramuricea clavata]
IAKLPKSKQYPKNVVNGKKENKVEEKNISVVEENSVSDVVEGNNNQAIIEDYTPILCKTQFITTTDYNTSDNALNFTQGTEMAVKGVRIDGWWFCYNKSTQESGWVYMDYLKPKNETWLV